MRTLIIASPGPCGVKGGVGDIRLAACSIQFAGHRGQSPPIWRLRSAIPNLVDCPGVVVGDEQTSVGHNLDIDRTAPGAVALEPAFGEDLLVHQLPALDDYTRDAVADALAAVPRTVLSDEDRVPIFRRKLTAGIEAHPE